VKQASVFNAAAVVGVEGLLIMLHHAYACIELQEPKH